MADAFRVGAAVIFALAFTVVAGGAFGFGEARSLSSYQGTVADIEEDRGLVFRTTQVHLRTSAASSSTEAFCVLPENEGEQLPKLREAQSNDATVQIEYSRPYFVSPLDCNSSHSIVRAVNIRGNSS